MDRNRFGWSGGPIPGDDEVIVRLDFVDPAGETIRSFEGSGSQTTEGCCTLLLMTLSEDGESLVAS